MTTPTHTQIEESAPDVESQGIETRDPAAAQAAIERLDQLAEEWAFKLHAAEKELSAVEASAGDTVLAAALEGSDGSQAAIAKLANARAAYDVAQKTLEAVERQQIVAQANLKLAQAHQLRQQAAEKRKEHDAHMAKVNALLGKLQDLEGAPYVPFKPHPLALGEYRDPIAYAVPLSETMSRGITELLGQADGLEVAAKNLLKKAEGQRVQR